MQNVAAGWASVGPCQLWRVFPAMDKTRDRLARLIRRSRALCAETDSIQHYVLEAASKAAELCVESDHIRGEARALRSRPGRPTGAGRSVQGRPGGQTPPGQNW
jgi:hypothetical protein